MAPAVQFWEIEFLCRFHCWPHRPTVKLFAHFRGPRWPGMSGLYPQVKARVQAEPPTCRGAYVLFADAAPVGPHAFPVGLYLPSEGVHVFQCPRWVSTLQVAELWGWVQGDRLATYMKWPRVCVGSDSTVARCQVQGQRGAVFCSGQQHILRALVWLRRWFGIPIAGFYIPSGCKPADPPSRAHDYDSMRSCLGSARERYWQWYSSPFPYHDFFAQAPFPRVSAPRDNPDCPSGLLAVDGA